VIRCEQSTLSCEQSVFNTVSHVAHKSLNVLDFHLHSLVLFQFTQLALYVHPGNVTLAQATVKKPGKMNKLTVKV